MQNGLTHSGALFSVKKRLSTADVLAGSAGPQTPKSMPSHGLASCSSSWRALSLMPSMISAALVRGANVGATPYVASVLSAEGAVRPLVVHVSAHVRWHEGALQSEHTVAFIMTVAAISKYSSGSGRAGGNGGGGDGGCGGVVAGGGWCKSLGCASLRAVGRGRSATHRT